MIVYEKKRWKKESVFVYTSKSTLIDCKLIKCKKLNRFLYNWNHKILVSTNSSLL